MATGRDQVVTALAALPARFRVIGYARDVDTPPPGTVAVVVTVDRVAAEAPTWRYEGTLYVLVPELRPGPADELLDEALEDVLYACDRSAVVRWTQAERGTWGEQDLPAYLISYTARLRPVPNA